MTTPGAQLHPTRAERITLDTPVSLAALRTGNDDAAAVALLVPGYTGSKEDFAPLLDSLADNGFQAISIDLPGQFESPGPPGEASYRPSALGAVVAELVGDLARSRPVLLLGHSYGGLVARGAVLAGAPIAGLTLLGSGPGRLRSPQRLQALDVGEHLLQDNGVAAAYDLRESLNDGAAPVAELREFLRRRFIASGATALLGIAHALREEPDLVDELAAALHDRGVPSLVVAGENDDAWSVPDQREMARRLDAPFALIPDAAHSPNTENPGALLDVLITAWRGWLR